jgi:hypothetical protein
MGHPILRVSELIPLFGDKITAALSQMVQESAAIQVVFLMLTDQQEKQSMWDDDPINQLQQYMGHLPRT